MLDHYAGRNINQPIYPSISLTQIDSIKHINPTKRIKRFSEMKLKRTLQCLVEYDADLYYIKNDTFNFYHKGFLRNNVLLKLPSVEKTFGNREMGYLIFVKKTMFYYLSENEKKIVGPIEIENYIEGTPYDLDKIDSENMRFELSYLPYERYIEKIQIIYNIRTSKCEQKLIKRKLPEQPEWHLRLLESFEKAKQRENSERKNN